MAAAPWRGEEGPRRRRPGVSSRRWRQPRRLREGGAMAGTDVGGHPGGRHDGRGCNTAHRRSRNSPSTAALRRRRRRRTRHTHQRGSMPCEGIVVLRGPCRRRRLRRQAGVAARVDATWAEVPAQADLAPSQHSGGVPGAKANPAAAARVTWRAPAPHCGTSVRLACSSVNFRLKRRNTGEVRAVCGAGSLDFLVMRRRPLLPGR